MISLAVCCGYVSGVWYGSNGEAEAKAISNFHGVKCLWNMTHNMPSKRMPAYFLSILRGFWLCFKYARS